MTKSACCSSYILFAVVFVKCFKRSSTLSVVSMLRREKCWQRHSYMAVKPKEWHLYRDDGEELLFGDDPDFIQNNLGPA